MQQPVSRWHDLTQSAGSAVAADAKAAIRAGAVSAPDTMLGPPPWLRSIVRAVKFALEAAALIALLSLFFVRLPQVSGHSMEPQLRAGDHVLINTLAYGLRVGGLQPLIDVPTRPIARDDLVAFAHADGGLSQIYVKRVIGLPGDFVSIAGGVVSIDGQPLAEPYVSQRDATTMAAVRVPQDSYFMLGDNRGESDDSRVFGAVPRRTIIGRATFIVWPFNRARPLR